jgi:predicted secreted protein
VAQGLDQNLFKTNTRGKRHSFVGYFKFIGTDKYIQIIFVGPKTDEYKLILIGDTTSPTNICGLFIGDIASPTNIRGTWLMVRG